MSSSAFSFRSPILALAVALALFAMGSLLREALQPHLGSAHYLGALVSLAVFLLTGALVGGWSPRHTLLHGVILGVLAGAFVTAQMAYLSHVHWTARTTLQVFGPLAGLGIILCEVGALGGRALARNSAAANRGRDRTGEA